MSKSSTSRLTAPPPNAASPPPPKLDLHFDVCACSFGHYPWDDWERFALAGGLDAQTAGLGRLLIREAYNHDWQPWLQNLCGWRDDLSAGQAGLSAEASAQAGGAALLAFALRSPEKARWCWTRLLETDGLRGDFPPSPGSGATSHPQTGEWTWGYLRLDVRRVLSTLHNATMDARQTLD